MDSAAVLEEIASLLLILHESYIKEALGWRAILSSLVQFLNDAALLPHLTILEVEDLRRQAMQSVPDQDDEDLVTVLADPTTPPRASQAPSIDPALPRPKSPPQMDHAHFSEWPGFLPSPVFPPPGGNGRKRPLSAIWKIGRQGKE